MALFCLLHGAWHDATCWEPLGAELRARGHRVVAPDLPLHNPATTYEERIRPALAALDAAIVAAGPGAPGTAGSIVVVGHSMGAADAPRRHQRLGSTDGDRG
ncbi:alpha/beta fold hydrolase, partial [Frankia sp. CcWB2]